MIQRSIKPSKTKSFFLFGPRGSGKTTFLQDHYAESNFLYIDLLDIKLFDEFMLDLSRFEALIDSSENINKPIIIDEVQKFPKLLNVVHSQIQKRKRQFILTGSSSRRLKQEGENLLAGRAWVYNLYPFSTLELGQLGTFELKNVLQWGSLPDAILAESPSDAKEYLAAYVSTYLQKEIQQEQWVRNLAPFRKFLAIAAQMNGKIINKSAIAREVGADDVTIASYFEILEDTLIGFLLPSHHQSVRKAQRVSPKFYFVDPGIKRALEHTLTVELLPQTSAWGDAFEHWIILEFIKNASYCRYDWTFSYLRTKDDLEIDLIIDRPGAKQLQVEIKSKSKVTEADVRSLETLGKDLNKNAERWLLSLDPLERKFGTTQALHWRKAISQLFKY